VKCSANFLRAAGSKIADFYFAAPARKKKIRFTCYCRLRYFTRMVPAFRIHFTRNSQVSSYNDVQPARCSPSAMTPSADSE
jgi:hypothetical protein